MQIKPLLQALIPPSHRHNKTIQVLEEPFDRWIFRPLARLLVPIFVHFRFHPNHVTLLSGILGSLSPMLMITINLPFEWVMALSTVSIVLDCADGQLARWTHQYSQLGRILDGISDYMVVTAWYLVLCIQASYEYPWYLVFMVGALTGFFHILQCITFETFQHHYQSISTHQTTREGGLSTNDGSKSLSIPFLGMVNTVYEHVKGIVAYRICFPQTSIHDMPAIYRWLFYTQGHSFHLVLMIICVLLNRAELFVFGVIIVINGTWVLGRTIHRFKRFHGIDC